jgi:hypothetical protein
VPHDLRSLYLDPAEAGVEFTGTPVDIPLDARTPTAEVAARFDEF